MIRGQSVGSIAFRFVLGKCGYMQRGQQGMQSARSDAIAEAPAGCARRRYGCSFADSIAVSSSIFGSSLLRSERFLMWLSTCVAAPAARLASV